MLYFYGLVGAYFGPPVRVLTGNFLCGTKEVTVLLCSVQILEPSTPRLLIQNVPSSKQIHGLCPRLMFT